MRVLACGDRNWSDHRMVWDVLDSLLAQEPVGFVLIEGQCPVGGADKHASEWAEARKKKFGVTHIPMAAEWNRYGRSAGPIRNKAMFVKLLEGDPDETRLVVAFHDAITESKGTKGMIEIAEAGGERVWFVHHEGSLI